VKSAIIISYIQKSITFVLSHLVLYIYIQDIQDAYTHYMYPPLPQTQAQHQYKIKKRAKGGLKTKMKKNLKIMFKKGRRYNNIKTPSVTYLKKYR